MYQNIAVRTVFAFAALTLLGTSPARADDDDFSFSAGLRAWNSQWQANSFPTVGGTTVAVHSDSTTKLVLIPVFSVRYKDYALSASRSMQTSYTLSDGLHPPVDEPREETDINLSYSLIQGLSASVGMKEVRWGTVVIKGPTLALTGSAPIGAGIGMYGTGGMGWLDVQMPGLPTLNADYALGEFGLTYSFDTKASLKGLTATLGYRYQKITAKSFSIVNNRDVNDITSGMTLGLIARF
ncbi:MAG: hypothetical protein V4858_03195 [Pseudomonadota bacterium]